MRISLLVSFYINLKNNWSFVTTPNFTKNAEDCRISKIIKAVFLEHFFAVLGTLFTASLIET